MNKRVLRADIFLLLTAVIWGFGFVAQRTGMQYVGPFTYNGIRFILASISLLPIVAWSLRKRGISIKLEKSLLFALLLAGTLVFIGVSIQQLGIMATTAGNAGFITGLYVIFTPIFGIFLGRRTGKATWLGAVLMLTGLYFLSTQGPFERINPGDIIIAISAVFWAFHVLAIDRLVQKFDPLVISAGQFAVAGLFSLAAAFFVEPSLSIWLETSGREFVSYGLFSWKSLPALIDGFGAGTIPSSLIANAMVPILYGGLVSVGIGYTLQVVAQRDAPPAHATIILCLEGGFAALGGILILHEPVGSRILIGFALALAGMLASQWGLIRSRPLAPK
jgi:drug/metabolite transporter (DMT)-like permease